MEHVTCLAHSLHRIAGEIRNNKLISSIEIQKNGTRNSNAHGCGQLYTIVKIIDWLNQLIIFRAFLTFFRAFKSAS